MITLYAFKALPAFAVGLARDLRIRWALEEAGLPYQMHLVTPEEVNSPGYRALQPFGQIPAIEEDGFRLFESGSIILHIGERSDALIPRDPAAKARAITWIFAAVNTIEPAIRPLLMLDLFHTGEEWAKAQRSNAEATIKKRLNELAVALGDRAYLEGSFTAGDLVMTTVLRMLRHTDLVEAEPRLQAHLKRCEARPAFQRALVGHMAVYEPA
jgi:glutathione S-transferase